METKRQELSRTVKSMPEANQRVFRCMYGRNDGKRPLDETLEMSIDDIVSEMSYRKLDWAQMQVYNTLMKELMK